MAKATNVAEFSWPEAAGISANNKKVQHVFDAVHVTGGNNSLEKSSLSHYMQARWGPY